MTTTAAVLVRDATNQDLVAVAALVQEAGLPLDGLADATVVLVADAGGRVVGTVALERHRGAEQTAFLLRSAAVDPGWRGHGVGGALTGAALDVVDMAGAPVGLLTETADDYFPRFGFVPVPRDELPAVLRSSAEFSGACPASARALLRPAQR